MRTVDRPVDFALLRIAASVAFAASALLAGAAHGEEINSIILRVNDEVATRYDYEERKAGRLAMVAEAPGLSPEERRRYAEEAPRATMREILDELLLVSRARQLVIEPSRAEIDEAVDNMRQRLGFGSEAELQNALLSSKMSLADYRDRTGRQIKASQVIQREVNPKVKVEDEWLQRYYRENADEFRVPARVRLRELVIPLEGLSSAASLELAAALRTSLAGGEEMAAAAARLGEERGVAIVGPVDLGWVEPGELAPELDAAVWSLPPGALSPPVEARGGLHLIEILERVESTMRAYVDVKGEIERGERNRRHDEVLREYLADLENRAYLVERIPAEAAGFRELDLDLEGREEADPLAAFAPKRDAPAEAPAEMERIPEERESAPQQPPVS